MGIVFRQSAKNTIVAVLGAILGAFIIWLSTKYTTKQQLGFTRNLTNYAVAISQTLLLGINSTLVVYIHKYSDNANKRKTLITLSLVLPAVAATIFTVVVFLLKDWILKHFQPDDVPFMRRYFVWLPIFTALFIYMIILEQYLGSQLKVAVSAFMREVVVRVANIILILLYGFGFVSFDVLVVGTVLIYLIPVAIFFLLSLRLKSFGFSLRLHSFSIAEYKDMIHFSWYHFLLGLALLLMNYMDALALPFYDHRGFVSVAIYSVAVLLISFIQLPFKALTPASFAVLAKAFADKDLPRAKDIFTRASTNTLLLTVGVSIIVCCNLQNAIAVIKNGYGAIATVFLILFIGRIVDLATGMNDHVLSIANYYKFNFYLSIIVVVVFYALIRVLVPRYSIYGAAWSATITTIIFNAAKYFIVWKKLDMQPFSKNTLLIIVCGLPALVAGYFFPYFFNPSRHVYVHAFIDAGLRSAVIAVIYILMLLWLKPSKDLHEYIATVRKDKRLF